MLHCLKSFQIRTFFWSVFSRIRTECGPEKTAYFDTCYAELPNTKFLELLLLYTKSLHLFLIVAAVFI